MEDRAALREAARSAERLAAFRALSEAAPLGARNAVSQGKLIARVSGRLGRDRATLWLKKLEECIADGEEYDGVRLMQVTKGKRKMFYRRCDCGIVMRENADRSLRFRFEIDPDCDRESGSCSFPLGIGTP